MSIVRQRVPYLEIIVLNDGFKEGMTLDICEQYGARYYWTGQRNEKELIWRCPGFALNVGVKKALGDIIIISCAEIWHVNNCLDTLLEPLYDDEMAIAIPEGRDDNGTYELDRRNSYDKLPKLNTKLPFLMAMYKKHYLNIGGYDEDFLGQGYDDNDFVDRLQAYGCKYRQTAARCVHLFHSREKMHGRTSTAGNKKLYELRRGQVVRNQHRKWGIL